MIEEITTLDEIENLYKTGSNAPYKRIENGHGYYGVMIKEKASNNIQCHICGKFFVFLATHVKGTHKLYANDYRELYGFSNSVPLCSPEISAKFRQRCIERFANRVYDVEQCRRSAAMGRKAMAVARKRRGTSYSLSKLNERNICPEQIDRRFLVVADIVGRNPTAKDLANHDFPVYKAMKNRFGTLNNYRKLKGYDTAIWNGKPKESDMVLEMLRKFAKKYDRLPRVRDFAELGENYCTQRTVISHFGSWRRALMMAGLKVA